LRVAPHRCEPSGLTWRLLLGLALGCVTPLILPGKEDQTNGLPPRVARVLRWLPEDTETLFVARSATLPEPRDPPEKVQWQGIGAGLAAGGIDLVDGWRHSKTLRSHKIVCIVSGARNFEGVSSFGSLRSESCAIIVFEQDLGDAAREWTESLRRGANSVRTLVGREVFVFPSMTSMEPWVAQAPWQGTFLVLLKPDTILCASSDRYLESVLRRVNDAPQARALPDNLPEWARVNFEAPVWMLRHVPKAGERANIVGSTATFTREGFRVVYIPKLGSDVNIKSLETEWLPHRLFNTSRLRDQLKIERQPDGTVALSCSERFGDDTLWFAWFQLYRLQAFELFIADE
jgi:hypothetical protein